MFLIQKSMLIRLVILLSLGLAITTQAESVSPFVRLQPNPALKKVLDSGAKRYQLSNIPSHNYIQFFAGLGEHLELSLPTVNGDLQLVLDPTKSMISAKGFEVFEKNKGQKRKVNYTGGKYYQGQIAGDASSHVSIAFFENGQVIGVAYSAQQGGNIVIGRLEQQGVAFIDRPLVVFDDLDLLARNDFMCAHPDDQDAKRSKKDILPTYSQQAKGVNAACKTISFYMEGGYTLYQGLGNDVVASTNHLTGIFNVVNNLYNVDQVHISIARLQINSSPDGIPTATSRDVLFAFRDSLAGGFAEDLAHYFTADLGLGGVAYLGVLCEPSAGFRTGMSDVDVDYRTLPLYSWSASVTAHEIGHNIGSPHTQWCGWDKGNGVIGNIDSCYATEPDASSTVCYTGPVRGRVGTIMSYCHLTGSIDLANGFGPLPAALLRSQFDNAPCLTGFAAPILSIIGSSAQCPGENFSLTAPSIAGAIYTWRGPNGFTTNANPALITSFDDTKAGIYSLEVQSNGCTYSPFPLEVKSKCITFTSPKVVGNVCNGDRLPISFNIGVVTTPTTNAVVQLGNLTGAFGTPINLFTITNIAIVNANLLVSGVAEGNYRLRVALTHKGVTTYDYLPVGIGVINKTTVPTTPAALPTCPNTSVKLVAPVNGFNNEWFTSGGTLVGTGATYDTPLLANNSSYTLRQTETQATNVGLVTPIFGAYRQQNEALFNIIRIFRPITLDGFMCDASSAGNVTIVVEDSITGAIVATATRAVVAGVNNLAGLGLSIPMGVYKLKGTGTTVDLIRMTSSPGYPFAVAGVCIMPGALNGGGFNTSSYYWFFDLAIRYTRCQSDAATYAINVGALATPSITALSATTFCTGGSVTLEAPAGLSYLWSNNATTRTISVSAGGSYSVRTIANGCTSAISATTIVTVTALPTTPSITALSATTFCIGGSVTLEAPIGLSYLWSNNATTRTISVSAGGSYSVRTIANGCTSAISAATVVTITALPITPSITALSATTFCTGGSVTLEAPAGLSYLWSNNATTRTITVSTPNSYTVRTIANGCTSAISAATIVTVTALPITPSITALSATTFCIGGSVTLEAPIGLSYLWSNNATTRTISVSAGGSYSVRTITNGCTSAISAATVVTVTALPTTPSITALSATTFCIGGSVTLEAPAGLSYLWSNNATTRTITVSTPNSYTVRTIANGCTSAISAATIVTVTALPITPSITALSATTFCIGGSVTLEAPIGLSYLWSNNATTRTISVSAGGSYSVRTITNGCTSAISAATVVTVTALPITPSINALSATTFCIGGSVTLEAPAGLSYLWSNNATSRTITVSTPNSYTVRTIANGCTSAISAATVVTVTALPITPSITALSATTFCTGGSVTLEAPIGLSYLWSNNATTRTISVSAGGSYSVRTIANGCTSDISAATIVTVTALPITPSITALSATTFCTGGSVTLEAPAGLSYLWSNNATTRTISVSAGGSYSVRTIANGCTSAISATTIVTVTALPITPSITRNSDTLSIPPQPNLTITWLLNGAPITGSTNSLVINRTGTYTVRVQDINGCNSTSLPTSVITGIDPKRDLTVRLFPNPVSQQLTIQFLDERLRSVRICNVLGQVVIQQSTALVTELMDVSHLAAGTYYLLVEGQLSQKFVKQ